MSVENCELRMSWPVIWCRYSGGGTRAIVDKMRMIGRESVRAEGVLCGYVWMDLPVPGITSMEP